MQDTFTDREASLLAPHVTSLHRPIFCLKDLPEEVIAVLFAYYSRSPDSLRRNLIRLIDQGDLDLSPSPSLTPDSGALAHARDKARQFHEKWVVGYGHASVAEHAVAHIAVEDVSILASKALEDLRLASFTEKSTRYVVFDRNKWVRPPEIMATSAGEVLEEACNHLMDVYQASMPVALRWLESRHPHEGKKSRTVYENALKAQACDVLRYLLPAATATNVGMTINGRSLEAGISKLLSHPLAEVRGLGEALKEESRHIIPTLVKYAAPSEYQIGTLEALREGIPSLLASLGDEVQPQHGDLGRDAGSGNQVHLVRYDPDAEERLLSAILYRFSDLPYATAARVVVGLSREEKNRVLDEYLSRRGRHDAPLREMEHTTYTFDVLLDYGAFRDVQRHRIATQTGQELGCELGFTMPPEVAEMGLEDRFQRSMQRAWDAWGTLRADFPAEAAYVVPLAFRKRVLITWNLRSLAHFIALRSSRQGHISYRRVAQACFREVERVHPLLARVLRVDLTDPELARL